MLGEKCSKRFTLIFIFRVRGSEGKRAEEYDISYIHYMVCELPTG